MNKLKKRREPAPEGVGKSTLRRLLPLFVAIGVLLAIAVACIIYVSDYYRADSEAIQAYALASAVSERELRDGTLLIGDESAEVGFIFYPGGKVEHTAYLPLMRALAERGILCALVKMPAKLAVLDMNAADGIAEACPDVSRWYIGGHSLGGSMAASHAAKHADKYCGVVLLASYSTADLSSSGLSVLSVYGSLDGVMNREKYEKYRQNLPSDLTELVINGGSHAYFGMYGEQDGDGKAEISAEEQIGITARAIMDFVGQI